MKAAVYHRYGPPEVVRIEEVEKPAPRENEILVRVHATAVTSGDWRSRKAEPFAIRLFNGILKPKNTVLGSVLAGTVEKTGTEVNEFEPGNRVLASTGMGLGAHAEYVTLPADGTVVQMPDDVSWEDAAGIPFGSLTALYFLKEKAGIEHGRKVLVYGASGDVGTAAVQLARLFGAEVTAVCGPTGRDLVTSLGAQTVVDYTKEDYAKGSERYDIVFDAIGKTSKSSAKQVLSPDGVFVSVASGISSSGKQDLQFLIDAVAKGTLRPTIDGTYEFERIADAHARAESGHKKGSVVVTLNGTGSAGGETDEG